MQPIKDFCEYLDEFYKDQEMVTGLGKIKIGEWIEERKQVYEYWKIKFNPQKIGELGPNDFAYFLTSKGNLSWTNLQRSCKKLIYNMKKLREAIAYLQDETISIEKRLDEIKKSGKYYSPGLGRNVITGILLVLNWHKYGVWNARTDNVLKYLDNFPKLPSKGFGNQYVTINNKLIEISKMCNIDLVTLDCFLFWFDDRIIKKKKGVA